MQNVRNTVLMAIYYDTKCREPSQTELRRFTTDGYDNIYSNAS